MINIFNRKELYMTYNLNKQAEVRSLLAEHGIEYDYKTIDRKSPSPVSAGSRARTGTAFEKRETELQYYIYVHKNDYDKARALLTLHGL